MIFVECLALFIFQIFSPYKIMFLGLQIHCFHLKKKMRFREVTQLTYGHLAKEWQNLNSNPGLCYLKYHARLTIPHFYFCSSLHIMIIERIIFLMERVGKKVRKRCQRLLPRGLLINHCSPTFSQLIACVFFCQDGKNWSP